MKESIETCPKNPVLVRIDDTGVYNSQKDCIIYNLCEAKIKVSCAVVPTWLTDECLKFLLSVDRLFPGHLEIHQHGYSHQDYSAGGIHSKYEFGHSRNYNQQLRDIIQGRRILENAFGPLFFPAFTPPYGEYNNSTLIALKEAKFKAISNFADCELESNSILPDFSPDIDCFLWDPIRERPWKDIEMEWWENSNHLFRGFILHPRFMTPESVINISNKLPELLLECTTKTFAQLVENCMPS